MPINVMTRLCYQIPSFTYPGVGENKTLQMVAFHGRQPWARRIHHQHGPKRVHRGTRTTPWRNLLPHHQRLIQHPNVADLFCHTPV